MKRLIALIMLFSLLNAQEGKKLYAICVACHGAHGEKSALGRSSIIRGQKASLTIKQLMGYKKGILDQHGMGKLMNKYTKKLSYEEIKKVAHYIEKL